MEEMEVPTEGVQEDLHERAHHASSREKWISWVALTSALLAALAAVTSLMAGTAAEHAMEHEIEANDKWLYYQAKSIKSQVVQSRVEMYALMGKPVPPADEEKLKEYKENQKEIEAEAKQLGVVSAHESARHATLAKGVTLFQVAIAIAAISVLAKRPPLWFVGIGLGVGGVVFLVMGAMS
jgi:hypothetical protein